MPINEYSHIKVEAAPFDDKFELSYHLYEVLPHAPVEDRWKTKIEVDYLGTVYENEVIGVPRARKIERGWESLWVDGRPGWATVERFIKDDTLIESESPPKKADTPEKAERPGRNVLPIAELPHFMFASPPGW